MAVVTPNSNRFAIDADDPSGVLALLGAIEPWRRAPEKAAEAVGAVSDGVGRDGDVAR
jgi:hypothetical protein